MTNARIIDREGDLTGRTCLLCGSLIEGVAIASERRGVTIYCHPTPCPAALSRREERVSITEEVTPCTSAE